MDFAELELFEALHQVFNLLKRISQIVDFDTRRAKSQRQRQNELLQSKRLFGTSLSGHFSLKSCLIRKLLEQGNSDRSDLTFDEFQDSLLLHAYRLGLFRLLDQIVNLSIDHGKPQFVTVTNKAFLGFLTILAKFDLLEHFDKREQFEQGSLLHTVSASLSVDSLNQTCEAL